MTIILRGIIVFALCTTVHATTIEVDLGIPRKVQDDIFLNIPALVGTQLSGQTLSLDYQFNRVIYEQGPPDGFYFAVRAMTDLNPLPDTLYPQAIANGYALGLNGYVGPSTLFGEGVFQTGPDAAKILFGITYASDQPGSYALTGLHFDLTLPEIENVEISGLEMHIKSRNPWNIANVPENANSITLLAFSFVMLVLARHKILHL